MTDILSVDFDAIMRAEFDKSNRSDGKLHASSASSPLRHAQLEAAGAPKKPRSFGDAITLQIGTLIHEWLHDAMRSLGVPYMAEVRLDPWLPPGWGGTADAVVWSPAYKAFMLVDYKTAKGESLRYRRQSGASEEHVTQTSIYWHALKKMGIPLVKKIAVLYIPKNEVRGDVVIEPLLVDFDPLPVRALATTMKDRKARVDAYVNSLPFHLTEATPSSAYITDELAEPQPMEQRIYRDSASGANVLKLVPHWSAAYCPFVEELCGCGAQKSFTIGRFDDLGGYKPRKGYEEFEPVIAP